MCAIYTFLYVCVLPSWSVCLLVLGVADSWIFLSPPPPFLLRWHLHFNFTFWWMDLHCELCRIAQNFHYFLNGRIQGGALKFVCPGCVCVWRPSIIIGLRFNLFVFPKPAHSHLLKIPIYIWEAGVERFVMVWVVRLAIRLLGTNVSLLRVTYE